jgi:hypothetical protein
MHTEDHLASLAFFLESPFNPNPSSEPPLTTNERVFPAELLDSGFELTNILTEPHKLALAPFQGAEPHPFPQDSQRSKTARSSCSRIGLVT